MHAPRTTHGKYQMAGAKKGKEEKKKKITTTYKLLLFIGHQFCDFTFTSCQYFFIVSEVTYNEFLFACMQLELFNHLLKWISIR